MLCGIMVGIVSLSITDAVLFKFDNIKKLCNVLITKHIMLKFIWCKDIHAGCFFAFLVLEADCFFSSSCMNSSP